MNAALSVILLVVCCVVLFLAPDKGPGALSTCALLSVVCVIFLSRHEERTFLVRLFVAALIVRLVVGIIIFGRMEEFFGGDANTYDIFGRSLIESWGGDAFHKANYERFVSSGAGAWGMIYLVAGVYSVIGRNMLAIQYINAAVGAVTAGVIFQIAEHLFNNIRVSKLSALLTAFFPSLILWSSQALKDSLIVMALALGILATLRLMKEVKPQWIAVLTGCLLILISLRFYIFYMMVASVVGAFVVGMKAANAKSFLQRFVAVALIGLAITWFGVLRSASEQFDRYANLEAIQRSRLDMASTAESGFGKDVDVRTTSGALTVIPVGLVYLMFAPFPWQLASLRQSIALPEMIVWWCCFPLLVLGLWYGMKHRLQQISPILIFTSMLTLAYSLFQGNVGTAYRQRSQLLVFYFIFVAVGAILLKERAENKQHLQLAEKQKLADLRAARILARRQALESQTTATTQ
ncbi:MAG TPA: glycosyltransferase family 39 protein [Pyrinomonadaceae bacterium]|nr:glycosyltransferase family 39 protein [Pyrinomonadaceae bacterium]